MGQQSVRFAGVAPGITRGASWSRGSCGERDRPNGAGASMRRRGGPWCDWGCDSSRWVESRSGAAQWTCSARRTDRERLRREEKWSAASSDNCPLWSARGSGFKAEAPRSGGERSERLDPGEHVRNDDLSDDAVRGPPVGKAAGVEHHPGGWMHGAGGTNYSLTNRGESPTNLAIRGPGRLV